MAYAQNSANYNWASSRRRYEWRDDFQDGMAPRDEALEKELFGEENHVHTGINFSKYESIRVSVDGENPPSAFEKVGFIVVRANHLGPDFLQFSWIKKFEDADLHPVMKENIRLARYTVPTPVQVNRSHHDLHDLLGLYYCCQFQRHSISIVTAGRDLMACAQTGSGKTAAFLVPTCSKLFSRARELISRANGNTSHFKARPLVLILAPTRELCSQIFDEARRVSQKKKAKDVVNFTDGNVDSIVLLPEHAAALVRCCHTPEIGFRERKLIERIPMQCGLWRCGNGWTA